MDIYGTLKDFAGPVATIIASLAAVTVTGYFARRQWRTAKDKLLLDLFDKRLAVYEELRQAFMRCREGNDQNAALEFKEAISRARFFFDTQVTFFLDQTARELNEEFVQRRAPRLV
jgi:hypothetical protein